VISLADDLLRGSYPPLVTPFRDGEVDYDAYASLVERQISGGSHGITVNGTTAEPSTLTMQERDELVRVAVEVADGRVPVVAATGSQSHAETAALTVHAAAVGADAVLIVTPYYVKPPQRGLVEYYRDLGARTALPLLVYHIPGRTAVDVPPATLEQIAEAAPTFVGLKHAVNDLGYVSDVRRRLGDDVRIFVGLEELSLPMLAVGATGLMNAVGNVAPAEVAALYESVAAGDLEAARKQHDALFELNQAVFWDTNPIPIKYLLKRLGVLPTNEHRLPMMPATRELEARLDDLLQRSGLA
jgi:4-hydroxy-tetrahydrodipicolinate synthase